jgi:hypothetical protein
MTWWAVGAEVLAGAEEHLVVGESEVGVGVVTYGLHEWRPLHVHGVEQLLA